MLFSCHFQILLAILEIQLTLRKVHTVHTVKSVVSRQWQVGFEIDIKMTPIFTIIFISKMLIWQCITGTYFFSRWPELSIQDVVQYVLKLWRALGDWRYQKFLNSFGFPTSYRYYNLVNSCHKKLDKSKLVLNNPVNSSHT